MTTQLETIAQINKLIRSKGYIYSLLLILFEDFHIPVEISHEVNYRDRLTVKEAAFILGFLIKEKLDFTPPDTPDILMKMKAETYELMEKLHRTHSDSLVEELRIKMSNRQSDTDESTEYKEIFGKGSMLVEAIFYSGTGAYDIQYIEYLDKKYNYDKEELINKYSFDLDKTKIILQRIKDILRKKSAKVNLYATHEQIELLKEELKKSYTGEDFEKHFNELLPMMKLHQYVTLFFEHEASAQQQPQKNIRNEGWDSFYKGLLDLFVVKTSDFDLNLKLDCFLKNFSLTPGQGLNKQFNLIGDYNLFASHPVIAIDEEHYLIPNNFLLVEAIYESPFYWLMSGKNYEPIASKNRGKIGEEITFDFLRQVFPGSALFKGVEIRSLKNKNATKSRKTDTDIDILCVLGSKAICVQVKSKKLTELSRKGNDSALIKDFKGAVQDAFNQGLICRKKILEEVPEFVDNNGKIIKLPEGIDEVFLMVVTTENYPSLTHQIEVFIDKSDKDPYPLAMTIFDLEIVAHYLSDPYDFLYYVRQRIENMSYFKGGEETVFLAHHLQYKLWRNSEGSRYLLDDTIAQLIDRNFYPFKLGVELPKETDPLENRWRDDDFNELCQQIKTLNQPKITDILFDLFDLSGEARQNLVHLIKKTKNKSKIDNRAHDFSMPPSKNSSHRVGFSYVSMNSNDYHELENRLFVLCKARKFLNKGDHWIGFGSFINSPLSIDLILFNDQKWEYSHEHEEFSNKFLGLKKGRVERLGKKIGRNEPCPCQSGLKYKNCCGKGL